MANTPQEALHEVIDEAVKLPDGYMPINMVILVKCLTAQGEIIMRYGYSNDMAPWDQLGMLELQAALIKRDVNR